MRNTFIKSIKNLKRLKYKTLLFSSICNKCGSKDGKIFKEKELIKTLKILGLFNSM